MSPLCLPLPGDAATAPPHFKARLYLVLHLPGPPSYCALPPTACPLGRGLRVRWAPGGRGGYGRCALPSSSASVISAPAQPPGAVRLSPAGLQGARQQESLVSVTSKTFPDCRCDWGGGEFLSRRGPSPSDRQSRGRTETSRICPPAASRLRSLGTEPSQELPEKPSGQRGAQRTPKPDRAGGDGGATRFLSDGPPRGPCAESIPVPGGCRYPCRGWGRGDQTVGAWQREVAPGFPHLLHTASPRFQAPGEHTQRKRTRAGGSPGARLRHGSPASASAQVFGRSLSPAAGGCRTAGSPAVRPESPPLLAPGSWLKAPGPVAPPSCLGPSGRSAAPAEGAAPCAARALFVFLAGLT